MYEFPRPPLKGIDRARLAAVIEPVVRAHGAEVVDVEWKSDRGGMVLRISVEKAGAAAQKLSTGQAAVDLELCANVARDLSPALDVADLITQHYNLEVGSPGVERMLRGEEDLVRFAGEKARFKLHEPVEGQRAIRGVIGPVADGSVSGKTVAVTDGKKTYEVPLPLIASAQLVFEFGPSPKPGGPKSGKAHGSKKPNPTEDSGPETAGTERRG